MCYPPCNAANPPLLEVCREIKRGWQKDKALGAHAGVENAAAMCKMGVATYMHVSFCWACLCNTSLLWCRQRCKAQVCINDVNDHLPAFGKPGTVPLLFIVIVYCYCYCLLLIAIVYVICYFYCVLLWDRALAFLSLIVACSTLLVFCIKQIFYTRT